MTEGSHRRIRSTGVGVEDVFLSKMSDNSWLTNRYILDTFDEVVGSSTQPKLHHKLKPVGLVGGGEYTDQKLHDF